MKKFLKNNILTILVTAIVCTSSTVYAVNYLAKDIKYKDTNVEDALNDLYKKSSSDQIYTLSHNYSYSIGTRTVRTASLNLEKGYYIIYASSVITTTTSDSSKTVDEEENLLLVELEANDATCNEIKNSRFQSFSSEYINTKTATVYNGIENAIGIWQCSLEQNTTISIKTNSQLKALTGSAESVVLNAIKIN
jgi:hypothetical protein